MNVSEPPAVFSARPSPSVGRPMEIVSWPKQPEPTKPDVQRRVMKWVGISADALASEINSWRFVPAVRGFAHSSLVSIGSPGASRFWQDGRTRFSGCATDKKQLTRRSWRPSNSHCMTRTSVPYRRAGIRLLSQTRANGRPSFWMTPRSFVWPRTSNLSWLRRTSRFSETRAALGWKRDMAFGPFWKRKRSGTPKTHHPRKKLCLSQQEFAARFGFAIGSVQNWEQGRRRPSGSAQILLTLIDRHPEVVEEALRAS